MRVTKEKAAENKYVRDKEVEFKIHARAHKLLGLWAAGKMGVSGAAAEEYAAALVASELAGNAKHLFEKIRHDLLSKQVHMSDHDIHAEIHRFEHMAQEQMRGE